MFNSFLIDTKLPKLTSKLRQTEGAHIFYLSEEKESYIDNALVFILDGIRNGDYVFMIENPPLTPHIFRRLKQLANEEELEFVKFANNFEFYWSEGNILPISIIQHFKKTLNAATQEGKFFPYLGAP